MQVPTHRVGFRTPTTDSIPFHASATGSIMACRTFRCAKEPACQPFMGLRLCVLRGLCGETVLPKPAQGVVGLRLQRKSFACDEPCVSLPYGLFGGPADCHNAERRATGKPLDMRSQFPLPLIAGRTTRPRAASFRVTSGGDLLRWPAVHCVAKAPAIGHRGRWPVGTHNATNTRNCMSKPRRRRKIGSKKRRERRNRRKR